MSHAKSTDAASKYMINVNAFEHLTNLVKYLNMDVFGLPEWEQNLIRSIKADAQQHLKHHFETSASTRQKFVSMPTDQWKEYNTGLFSLVEKPRPVLGYLPKPELEALENICKTAMANAITQSRETLHRLLDEMRASDADRNELKDLLASGSTFLEDVEKHQQAVDFWTNLRNKKVAILRDLKEREDFLQEVDEFEYKSGDPRRYTKSNSLELAKENKFRSTAAKKLHDNDNHANNLCRQYQEETGRPFEIDGINFLEVVKEQSSGRSSNPSLPLVKSPVKLRRSDGEHKPTLEEQGIDLSNLVRKVPIPSS